MKYAELQNGVCVNTIVADEVFARIMHLIQLEDGYGIGDYYIDGVWMHELPEPEPVPESGVTDSEMATAILEGVNDV